MERVLVTGGAGFLGSHLCDWLMGNGYHVFCLDNLITGSRKNIKHLEKLPNFIFQEKDVSLDPVFAEPVGYLFHLASPASPVDYQKYPEETARVNSQGTLNMLKLAAKFKARFLLASTSEIYGDPKEHPQKETYWGHVNSFGPRSCYDESKRFAETLTYIYLSKYKVNARIVRIFNTYGPRMQKDDGRVVSNFVNQALTGEPLTIYGTGQQTRSFCYVSDLIDGMTKAMFMKSTTGEVINLGNPTEYRIIDFARKIKKLTGSKSATVFKPLPQDDPTQRCPDINKAKKILRWSPKISLDQGLRRTIEYYTEIATEK